LLDKGTTVAGYRIDGVLGQGGMGVVYEATQLSLDRKVALKLLATHLGEDPQFRERFRREALIQAGIDHPHIVTVYEAGEDPEGLFMAMRLVKCSTTSQKNRQVSGTRIRGTLVSTLKKREKKKKMIAHGPSNKQTAWSPWPRTSSRKATRG
jgi:serine/threonine protein kinase